MMITLIESLDTKTKRDVADEQPRRAEKCSVLKITFDAFLASFYSSWQTCLPMW